MKRLASILIAASVCLSGMTFTSCHGLPPTVAQLQKEDDEEAEALLLENQKPFIDKVVETYGERVSLTGIECVRIYPNKYDPGYTSYIEELKGTITLDGKRYEALYDCKNGTLRDSVHTDAVCSELADALPLDKSRIVETVYPELDATWQRGDSLKFPCEIKNFDDAVSWEKRAGAGIFIRIYTLEDVSGYTEADFDSIPTLQKLIDSTSYDVITVMSLSDTSALDDLKEQMKNNPWGVERLFYTNTTEETIAEFCGKYHLSNAKIVENKYSDYEDDSRGLEVKILKE